MAPVELPPRPPATAPPLTSSEQLSQAWRIAQELPDTEREELHRRLTETLPVVVTAEPVNEAQHADPASCPSNRSVRPQPAKPGAWWRRLAATAVDTALVQQFVSAAAGTVPRRKRAGHAVSFTIYLLYHVVSHWTWRGQSIGKKLFRLRVVRSRDDLGSSAAADNTVGTTAVSFVRIAIRSLLSARGVWSSSWHSRFLALDVAIGLFFGGRSRQCLHDSITGTKVVAASPRTDNSSC